MTDQRMDNKLSFESNKSKDEIIEIDLKEIARKIISFRRTIYKAVGIGGIIGLIIAFSVPKQYTVRVTLSPEMGSSKDASLSADIVSSTPFLLELSTMKIPTLKDEPMTLNTYLDEESSPWWNYVIGFPGMIIGGVKSLFIEENKSFAFNKLNRGTIELSNKEFQKIEALKSMITASVDKKTSMTSVTVTLQNPKVAAIVADSVVKKLQEYIIGYRTFKAKEDCAYLEKLFKERQQEYYAAQKTYANYIDSHDNIILQSVRTEQERLQNDMTLAYQVYSQVANQLQVARAKVQEEKPVFAIVEPAVVPLKSSGTSKKVYVLVFMFLSVCIVLLGKLFGDFFLNKFKEIRA